jgi:hypothetical protein
MTAESLDLTPPGKTNGKKEAKAPKAPKVEKAPADPNAPKKERAPRQNYGYAETSLISLTGKENKYRGARKKWYDSVVALAGKSVKEWSDSQKAAGEKDPPRGWLRFFIQDGTVALIAVPAPAAAEPAKAN